MTIVFSCLKRCIEVVLEVQLAVKLIIGLKENYAIESIILHSIGSTSKLNSNLCNWCKMFITQGIKTNYMYVTCTAHFLHMLNTI